LATKRSKTIITTRSYLLKLCLLLAIGAWCAQLQAAETDSTTAKPKKTTTLNDTWFLNGETDNHHVIDTTIFDLEQFNPIQRNGIEYANTGNLGGAAFPLQYSIDKRMGFDLGYHQFDLYKYCKDSIKYYQVVRPYAEISMVIGLKKEQMYRATFANQHKGIIYYGVDFTRMNSPGTYTNQATNDNGFSLYGIYNSKNKHWNVQADLVFNAFKVGENGGVANDIFDSTLFKKTLAEVNLQSAGNNYRQTDFYLTTAYNAGKKYNQRINDSTTTKVLMQVFKISYQFNIEKTINKYLDSSPDSAAYGIFMLKDSVFNNIKYLKIGNAVNLQYNWRKLTSDSTYMDKNLIVYASAGYDYYMLAQNGIKNNLSNLYVSGGLRNSFSAPSKILYRAQVKYYPYGWNQNDFLIDGLAGYDFKKWGMLTANYTYQIKEQPYIYEQYTSHPVNWSYSLPKMQTMALGAMYQNPAWGITLDANYYWLSNLPVYPGRANPFYEGGKKQNFITLHAGQKNSVAGLHIENEIFITLPNGKGSMTDYYAFIYTKHSLFYENRLFKKALWLSTGFDVRFRYNNNPPYYDPLFGAFYPVAYNARLLPQLDYFLNLKIKTVRVLLVVTNLASAVTSKGYYSLYRYPAPDISFKFGIKWRFFE